MRDRNVRIVRRGLRNFTSVPDFSQMLRGFLKFLALLPGLKRGPISYQRSSGSGRSVGETETPFTAVSDAERFRVLFPSYSRELGKGKALSGHIHRSVGGRDCVCDGDVCVRGGDVL